METESHISSEKGYRIDLSHHSRPITDLKFNRDGDLLFSSSMDTSPCLWRENGTLLGSFDGHEGAVWCISPNSTSNLLMTGSTDRSAILWDVETGCLISKIKTNSSVKGVNFALNSDISVITCDNSFDQKPFIGIYDTRSSVMEFEFYPETTPTKSILDYSNNFLVYSDTLGNVNLIDLKMKKLMKQKRVHTAKINNIRTSWCSTFFITSSSDAQSKIIDFEDLTEKKAFVSEEPVNCSAIFNTNDKVICAGGINARDVTLTRTQNNFDVNFFDIVTCKKVGAYSTHFGTINAIDVHPSCEFYCSGGEDAIICIIRFGEDFKSAPFTKF